MFNKALNWFEDRLYSGSYFRRGLAVAVLILTYKLTEWGMMFANIALNKDSDLVGTAAVITAVSGIPVALLTLLLNKYVETRTQENKTDANPT